MRFLSRIFTRRPPPGEPSRLPSPDALVLLARPSGEAEAQISRDLLEQAGIRALVRNIDAATAQSGAAGPPWAYELWVLRKDLRRAREVLGVEEEQPAGDSA
ncbi:MAG: DUF2007 domain-containing protein [Dehalococcoidia bacterium]